MATAFQTRSNIQAAGISTVEIRDTGADQTWYTIPYLRDVKVTETVKTFKNSKGWIVPHTIDFAVTGKMTATNSVTNCLGIIDDIASQQLDCKVTAINGTIWDSAGATGDGCGVWLKLVSDSDMDSERYLEFRLDRSYKPADSDAFHTAQSNVETGTDTELAKLESIARTDVAPAGIVAVGIGVGNYTDYTMSYVRNSKFYAETLVSRDQYGRSVPYAIKCDFEIEAMTAAEDASQEITLLDTLNATDYDIKLTFADARTASFDSLLGMAIELHNESDSDDIQFLKIMGSGVITFAQFASLWA